MTFNKAHGAGVFEQERPKLIHSTGRAGPSQALTVPAGIALASTD